MWGYEGQIAHPTRQMPPGNQTISQRHLLCPAPVLVQLSALRYLNEGERGTLLVASPYPGTANEEERYWMVPLRRTM